MSRKQYRPKWLFPVGLMIFLIGLAFLMYLVIFEIDINEKEFLIVAILALVVGGSFTFMGGEIGLKTKAAGLTEAQLAGLDSFVPFLAMRGGTAAFLVVLFFGTISYVHPEIIHAITRKYTKEDSAEVVVDSVTKTAAETVNHVGEEVEELYEEVKEVVNEEPKYQPPKFKLGPKSSGF